jgi:hypothetical protein
MLASLANEIKEYLNAIPPGDTGWGGGYEIPEFLSAELALDPATIFSSGKRGLWIVPVVTNYNLEQGNKRGIRVNSFTKLHVISVTISIPFNTFKENDVASWEEIEAILNLREAIDSYIVRNEWSLPLLNNGVMAEPPIEIEMNQRWFLSMTEFTFEDLACG